MFPNINKSTKRITNKYYDKKRSYKNNHSNDDSDDEEHEHMTKSGIKPVYRDYNHIYFRGQVTTNSIATLCNLIDEYNREQDSLQASLVTAIVVPKPLYLHITSFGGCLFSGFLGYDYIKKSKIPIYTIAEGYTVSSGASLFMAGKRRFMTENSYLLAHQLSETHMGTQTFNETIDNTVNNIEFMTKLYDLYLNNIRHHTNKILKKDILTKEILENHMMHDIYWNYNTCFRYGLTDGLYSNYSETDDNDIKNIIGNDMKGVVFGKTYSLNELKPSEKFLDTLNKAHSKSKNLLNVVQQYLSDKKNKSTDDDSDNDDVPKKVKKSVKRIRKK
jgi:ATP-dependent protease ClpP protease subunit